MKPPRREAQLYEAIRLVRPLYRHVYRLVEDGLADEGISVAMRALLEHLRERGPATVPEVARTLAFPRQVIQRLVDALLARGLVERVANPAHRRSHLVRLTGDGEATIARVLEREAVTLREVAAPLSVADVRAFHATMTYLTETFARRAPVSSEADAGERGARPVPPRRAGPATSARAAGSMKTGRPPKRGRPEPRR